MEFDELSNRVIGCALEVHSGLGPGLLESIYEQCLEKEFELNEIPFRRQVPLPIVYKGLSLECGYRIDIVVGDSLILELESVEALLPVHEAQLLAYLKLTKTKLKIGLLINFNSARLKDGIRRFVL